MEVGKLKYCKNYTFDGIETLFNNNKAYLPKSGINFLNTKNEMEEIPVQSAYGYCLNYKKDNRDTLIEERCEKLKVEILFNFCGNPPQTIQNKIIDAISENKHRWMRNGLFHIGNEIYKPFLIQEERYSTPFFKNMGFVNIYNNKLFFFRTGNINGFFQWQKRYNISQIVKKLGLSLDKNTDVLAEAYNASMWSAEFANSENTSLEKYFNWSSYV